jgi:hypothetical protein
VNERSPSAAGRPAFRQVRASFTATTIRVYQAYSGAIADAALAAQTFRPPFKRSRMTWIKPSFNWMMYRAGWATKGGQERILGIDLTRAGFERALGLACLSEFDASLHGTQEEWERRKSSSPVRIQWDPERSVMLEPLPWRAIQVGLGGGAVDEYVDEWITAIEDLTSLAHRVYSAVKDGDRAAAQALVPIELPYPMPAELARQIGCDRAE